MSAAWLAATVATALLLTTTATNGQSTAPEDFCDTVLCPTNIYKGTHTACNADPNAFVGKCPAGNTTLIPMDERLRTALLQAHNQARNDIARGALKGYGKATKMMELVR